MSYDKNVFRSLAMVTQLGLSVVTPIFLCIFLGYQIDSRFGTKLMVLFLILGTLAGGRCAWGLAVNILNSDKKERERQEQERRDMPGTSEFHKPKEPSRIHSAGTDRNEEAGKDGMA